MRIGEFARRVGVTTDTIRFYEKVGFFSTSRSGNGYRLYGEDDLEVAELIAAGKMIGFSLREIPEFLDEMAGGGIDHPRVQAILEERIEVIDSRIAALHKTRELVLRKIDQCRGAEAAHLAGGS